MNKKRHIGKKALENVFPKMSVPQQDFDTSYLLNNLKKNSTITYFQKYQQSINYQTFRR